MGGQNKPGGQQRKPAFLLNVGQATTGKKNLIMVPHLCLQCTEAQQQSLGVSQSQRVPRTNKDTTSFLLFPAQALQVELVLIRMFTAIHVKLISTLTVCAKPGP